MVGLRVLRQSDTVSTLGAGDTPLLVLEAAETTLERHSSGAGLFHNAFRVPSRGALGDALARIRERWHLGGASDHGVSEALYATDPERNGIEIYRDFPQKEWPVTAEGSVRMGTDSLDLEAVRAAATGDTTVPPGTDVGHVHLEVSSLKAFQDFYVDTIGFEVQTTVPAAVFAAAGGYHHHHVAANTWNHRSGPVGGRGLSWFEVLLPKTSALESIGERLTDSQFAVTALDDGIAVSGPDEIEVRFGVGT